MNSWNLDPFPALETERLQLRRITEKDIPDFFLFRSDPEIMKYLDRPVATSRDDIKKLLAYMDEDIKNNKGINWGIYLKNENRLIGTIGYFRTQHENYRSEIGYMIHSDYWGKGIVPEAVQKIIEYGFNNLSLHSIEANINPGNEASRKLLLKTGFEKEAYFRENFFFNGKFMDTEVYSLLNPNS